MTVYIVAGALGSGKTSLILGMAGQLAREGLSVAIIENEAGENPIDSDFLKDRGFTVRELYSGCICCSLRSELSGALDFLLKEASPDVLFIEPSGIAAPDIVRKTVEPDLAADHRIMTLMLNDMQRFAKIDRISPFFRRCFETADLIVSNKVTRREEETPYPQGVPVIPWPYGDPPPVGEILKSLPRRVSERLPVTVETDAPPVGIVTARGEFIGSVSDTLAVRAADLLKGLRRRIIRSNGSALGHIKLHFPGDRGGMVSLTGETDEPGYRGELDPPEGERYFQLSLLLYGISHGELKKILMEYLETGEDGIKIDLWEKKKTTSDIPRPLKITGTPPEWSAGSFIYSGIRNPRPLNSADSAEISG